MNIGKESKKILEFLEKFDEQEKQTIILECSSKIGTQEWKDSINDLWKRMLELDQKKE